MVTIHTTYSIPNGSDSTGGLALKTCNFMIMNEKVSNRYELYEWTDKLGWECIAQDAIGGYLFVIYTRIRTFNVSVPVHAQLLCGLGAGTCTYM